MPIVPMKVATSARLLSCVALLVIRAWANGSTANAQAVLFRDNPPDEPVRTQAFTDFVPGELLVRLRDEVAVPASKAGEVTAFGVPAIDRVLAANGLQSIRKLLPNEQPQPASKRGSFTTISGQEIEVPNLHNIYHVRLGPSTRLFNVIDSLQTLPEVLYAEPNYVYSIADFEPAGPVLTEEDVRRMAEDGTLKTPTLRPAGMADPVIPNDPLYPEQWYVTATNVDDVWSTTTGSTDAVIAIIDTGVDWEHPDLRNKIWTNPAELNGIEGVDDDGNGFVDDVRGWDFINNDNDPRDDNSHGTHVAGIAAAEANNGIGIAGVSWGARILPIKAFQSTGRGDLARILPALQFAHSSGATVINMSFGLPIPSSSLRDALGRIYPDAVLVASAGNSGLCIGPNTCPDGKRGYAVFPAALSFVIGTEATTATSRMAPFSNYDHDGPSTSQYGQYWNYETRAPGTAVLSTVPNGQYRLYSGTSMSSPLIAGVVSLALSTAPAPTQEQLWSRITSSTEPSVSAIAVLSATPIQPRIQLLSYSLLDSQEGDDNDGRADAGEGVAFTFHVLNAGGSADSLRLTISLAPNEDQSLVDLITPSARIGAMSEYSRLSNTDTPMLVRLGDNIVHNRDIEFSLAIRSWQNGVSFDAPPFPFVIRVTNAQELGGLVATDLTLYRDKSYVVTDHLLISRGATLTLEAGTELRMATAVSLTIMGTLNAIGSQVEPVKLVNDGSMPWGRIMVEEGGVFRCSHCYISTLGYNYYFVIESVGHIELYDSFITDSYGDQGTLAIYRGGTVSRSQLSGNWPRDRMMEWWSPYAFTGNLVSDNILRATYGDTAAILVFTPAGFSGNSIYNNFSIDGSLRNIRSLGGAVQVVAYPGNYWGSSDRNKVDAGIHDFFDRGSGMVLNVEPFLVRPSSEVPAHVWKIEIDGIDSQDQSSLLSTIGSGRHRFDVHFNRAMDVEHTPWLTFGVREPWTQNTVARDASWSADSTTWTAYYDFTLHTGDGINRLRVSDAKSSAHFFSIPVENVRFEFVVDAAGVASTEFNATPGLGKVALEWRAPASLDDLLGYNLYRFQNITDSTYTDKVIINSALLIDTTYTDFDVTPGTRYYYQYTVVKTDFSESDLSDVVGAQALTAAAGDANGDFNVTVGDVVTVVAYILGNNPQPFIFEAADVNRDGAINVLDVVWTVNIALGASPPAGKAAAGRGPVLADLRMEDDGTIRLEARRNVAGLELLIAGARPEDVLAHPELRGMEVTKAAVAPDTVRVLIYNLRGKPLATSSTPLLAVRAPNASLMSAVLADEAGESVTARLFNGIEPTVPETYVLDQNYPNPFNAATTIRYGLPQDVADAEIEIFDVIGRRVRRLRLGAQPEGFHRVTWNGATDAGITAASGVYLYRLRARGVGVLPAGATGKMVLLK